LTTPSGDKEKEKIRKEIISPEKEPRSHAARGTQAVVKCVPESVRGQAERNRDRKKEMPSRKKS